jgi:Rho GDP-dissociation inhibitor
MDDNEREKENENEKEKHYGTDVEDEEEDEEGNKRVVVLGPQVPLKEQLELDKVHICPLNACLNNVSEQF